MKKQHSKQPKQLKDRDGEPIPRAFSAERRQHQAVRPDRQMVVLSITGIETAATGGNLQFTVANTQVNTATEWAQWTAIYQEYRVVSITCRCAPRFFTQPAVNLTSATVAGYPGSIVSYVFCAASLGTVTAALQAQGSKVWNGFAMGGTGVGTHRVSAQAVNPYALEWTPTSGTPTATQQYGVGWTGSVLATALWNALVTHDFYIDFEVEFRTRL